MQQNNIFNLLRLERHAEPGMRSNVFIAFITFSDGQNTNQSGEWQCGRVG
jgi:hypothetical protein